MKAALASAAMALALAAPAFAAFPQDPPNDPLFDSSPLPNSRLEQWDLQSPALGFDRGISADRAWRITTGRGVVLADIDVGVDLEHEDLRGRFALNPGENGGGRASNGRDDDGNGYVDDWRGWDFFMFDNDPVSETRNNHGTNVAGVLGAATDNARGIAGIVPDGRVLPLRTADNILHQGSRLANAIVYAADRHADVLSMSLGAESRSLALRRAVAYAEKKGSVIVAPTGNEFHYHHNFPASFDEVVTVGGINPNTADAAALRSESAPVATDFKVRAAYSDYGPQIDVVAPTQVPTTDYGSRYSTAWSGTSAAAPHAAGVAGLVAGRGRELGMPLRPGEIRQILRQSADDLGAPGFDTLTGWGRVNALEAVRRVAPGRIPPEPDITGPEWFSSFKGRVRIRGRVSGRSPTRWTLELGEGEQPASWRTIASGGAATKTRRLATLDSARLRSGGHTLRLRATDSRGNAGEDRHYLFSNRDPALKRGYPKNLRSSGEASPTLADLNGDGVLEIVLATSDGLVRVYKGKRAKKLKGWPRKTRGAFGARFAVRKIGRIRSAFLGSPAVGNISGDERPEIVAAATDGRVYAWNTRGRKLRRFPVRVDIKRPPPNGSQDFSIYASPALADLTGDRKLDIVVGAADQKVYAWKGNGKRLPGWPVLARDGGDQTKILSSPAIGDLNGDGSPDVVEGTGEAYGTTPNTSGRVYAWNARGKRLPGWPVKPGALVADGIPLAGEGVPDSPSLADVDGDGRDEVAVSAFTGQPELYRGDGSRLEQSGGRGHFQTTSKGSRSRSSSTAQIAIGANSAFGRTSPGGPLRFFSGLIDLRLAQAQSSPAQRVPFEHLFGGWDARSGSWLAPFPIPVEGWEILAAPAIADVDGDGRAEVLAGSSGLRLHAFREDGTEPAGWPKQTGGWLLAGPAVGDVDGDRLQEVVAISREGNLFAWDTKAPAGGPEEWPSFRHDARNSGRYVPPR